VRDGRTCYTDTEPIPMFLSDILYQVLGILKLLLVIGVVWRRAGAVGGGTRSKRRIRARVRSVFFLTRWV
jgi:hypothetical protein